MLPAEVLEALGDPSLTRLAIVGEDLDAAIDEETGLLEAVGPEIVGWLTDQRSAMVRAALDEAGVDTSQIGLTGLSTEPIAAAGPQTAFGETWIGGVILAPLMLEVVSGRIGESGDIPTEPRTSRDVTTQGRLQTVAITTMSLRLSISGSTVISEADVSQQSTTTDTTTGLEVVTGSHRTYIRAELTACPDASGRVVMKIQIDLTSSTGGALGSTSFEAHSVGERVGQVDDAAFLVSETETMDMTYGTTSTNGASRTGSGTITIGSTRGPQGRGFGRITNASQTTGSGTMSQADSLRWQNALYMTSLIVTSRAFEKAQELWRGGKCVKIVATESNRLVDINEVVSFTAKPVHIIEGIDLDKKVVATLAGGKAVDPAGVEQDPPASITYLAPSRARQGGIVTITSTSNRGIGKLDIDFRTRDLDFVIDQASGGGRIKGQKCGGTDGEWVADGTYDRGGFEGQQQWVVEIDGSTGLGTFVYTDHSEGVFAGITIYQDGTAEGTASVTVSDEGQALMHLQETRHSYTSYTSAGGEGQDASAPTAAYDMAWEAGGNC